MLQAPRTFAYILSYMKTCDFLMRSVEPGRARPRGTVHVIRQGFFAPDDRKIYFSTMRLLK
jgi:hypothetical protein